MHGDGLTGSPLTGFLRTISGSFCSHPDQSCVSLFGKCTCQPTLALTIGFWSGGPGLRHSFREGAPFLLLHGRLPCEVCKTHCHLLVKRSVALFLIAFGPWWPCRSAPKFLGSLVSLTEYFICEDYRIHSSQEVGGSLSMGVQSPTIRLNRDITVPYILQRHFPDCLLTTFASPNTSSQHKRS